MSVVARSPFSGNKRIFEDDLVADSFDRPSTCKRGRYLGSPAAGCRGSPKPGQGTSDANGVISAAFNALRGLFPEMDEQTVSNVLAECGQDIDAAIRRLTQLRIDTAQQQHADQPSSSTPAAAAAAAPKSPPATAAASAAPTSSVAPADPAGPQTAEEWVTALVQEMAASKDMTDARLRGSKLLHAFEQFTTERVRTQNGHGSPSSSGSARLEELQRENAILKRAVQIQAARIQEQSGKDQELAGLRSMVGQYQERLRALELSNYSLSLHLQRATGGAAGDLAAGNHRPDVF